MKKIKEEDLILYLYNECSPAVTTAIDQALAHGDIELKEKIGVLKQCIRQLNKLKPASPARISIKTIMEYARAYVRRN